MEGAVPGRVTEMPAMALANCVASIKSIPPLGATAWLEPLPFAIRRDISVMTVCLLSALGAEIV